jgi:coenzyme F420-reducing hydrogenase beta subunit
MLRVTVEKLQPGQVLAQDVTRDDGVILMGQGTAVTEDTIRLLRRLEVEAVVVEGDRFGSEEERQAYLRQQEEALEERFSRVTGDKVLVAIREMFRRRIQSGCTPPPAEPEE